MPSSDSINAHAAPSADRFGGAPVAEGSPAALRLRSGTVARLAGVPVATLRVWERRYAVVSAPKTATGHRVYSQADVLRIRLLKQLTDRGHAIGSIATLAMPDLQALADGMPAPRPGFMQVVVVGRGAAQRLATAPGLALTVFDDIAAAEAGPVDVAADLLLVHLSSLQPAAEQQVPALAARWGTSAVVVLYAFGAEAVADALRAKGMTVRREPATGRDLVRLIGAARPSSFASHAARAAVVADASPAAAPARRFSDHELVRLAEAPSTVACECPRHLAEIVMQLGGFERYSAECVSRSPQDAALHRHLSELAGTARALLEQALERVAIDEGLLPLAS